MNITFIADDKKGPGFYRMMTPANEIRKANLAGVRMCFQATPADIEWADIVVIQRGYLQNLFEMVDWAKSIGKIVVYENDDCLQALDPSNPSYRIWNPAGPHLQRALSLMEKCDALTVTTPRMQREYAPWNKNIYVLPNCLDRTLWGKPNQKKKDKRIRIGYTAAASHQKDLEMIEEIMTEICAKHPEVIFVILGIDPENKFRKIPRVDYSCPHCKRKGQLEIFKGVDIVNYPSKLADMGFDIGIAPLVDNNFNACKSDLKFREYSALGIPTVASKVYPYEHSIKHGKTGYLAANKGDWIKYIELLIKDAKKRSEIGKNAKKWLDANGWIQDNVALWVNTYERIYQNYLKKTGALPQD